MLLKLSEAQSRAIRHAHDRKTLRVNAGYPTYDVLVRLGLVVESKGTETFVTPLTGQTHVTTFPVFTLTQAGYDLAALLKDEAL